MFEGFASFVYRNRRRVLLVAVVVVAAAGAFGLGVTKRMSPYGDTDPVDAVGSGDEPVPGGDRSPDRPRRDRTRNGRRRPQRESETARPPDRVGASRESRRRRRIELLRQSRSGPRVPRWKLDVRRRVF